MTYSDAYNIRTTSVKFNDIADALDGLITRQSTTTYGTSNLYFADPDPAWLEYTTSAILIITPHTTNAAGAQISVNGLGARDLKIGGVAITANVIQQSVPTILAYNGVHFEVLLQNVSIPTGQVTAFAGTTAPASWLLCDGQDYAIADYPALSGVIGTTYNIGGEAAGRFRVPDLRRRAPIGKGTSDTLGNAEGETKAGTAYASRNMTHTHSVPRHYHSFSLTAAGQTFSGSTSGDTGTTGSTHGHGFSLTAVGGTHSHTYQFRDTTENVGSGGFSTGWKGVQNEAVSGNGSHEHTIGGTIGGSSISATDGQHTHDVTLSISHTHASSSVSGSIGTSSGSGGVHADSTSDMVSGSATTPYIFINYIIKT